MKGDQNPGKDKRPSTREEGRMSGAGGCEN